MTAISVYDKHLLICSMCLTLFFAVATIFVGVFSGNRPATSFLSSISFLSNIVNMAFHFYVTHEDIFG